MIDGTASWPGAKFLFNRGIVFDKKIGKGNVLVRPFFSSGASIGFVHEHKDPGYGFELALTCAGGLHFRFPERGVTMILGLQPELGVMMKTEDSKFSLSLYKNGLYQAVVPFLDIFFDLKRR